MRAWIFVVFIQAFLWGGGAQADIWPHASSWNEAWESAYSNWVRDEVGPSWLKDPLNPFYRWPVDCAKFVYLTRLYFSFLHGLEFSIRGNLSEGIITSRSGQWDNLTSPKDRLLRFARYVFEHVDTSTLGRDSVLIALNKTEIRPGVFLSADSQREHTWLIRKIHPSGIPELLYATLPSSEYLYESFGFPASVSAFPLGKLPTPKSAGLRRFRWPSDLQMSSEKIAYASMDQTHLSYESFFDDVQKAAQVTPATIDERFQYQLEDLCQKVRVRVNVIIDAGHALIKSQGKISKNQIHLYSTDLRDRDISIAFKNLDDFYSSYRQELSPLNVESYLSLLKPSWTPKDYCWIVWADNRTEPLGYIREKFLRALISSDANASFAERWGEPAKTPSIDCQGCAH